MRVRLVHQHLCKPRGMQAVQTEELVAAHLLSRPCASQRELSSGRRPDLQLALLGFKLRIRNAAHGNVPYKRTDVPRLTYHVGSKLYPLRSCGQMLEVASCTTETLRLHCEDSQPASSH